MWKDVVGYEGIYEVNELGDVKSLERKVTRCDSVTLTIKEKLLSKHYNSDKYPCVKLSKDGKSKNIGVHILVAEALGLSFYNI